MMLTRAPWTGTVEGKEYLIPHLFKKQWKQTSEMAYRQKMTHWVLGDPLELSLNFRGSVANKGLLELHWHSNVLHSYHCSIEKFAWSYTNYIWEYLCLDIVCSFREYTIMTPHRAGPVSDAISRNICLMQNEVLICMCIFRIEWIPNPK